MAAHLVGEATARGSAAAPEKGNLSLLIEDETNRDVRLVRLNPDDAYALGRGAHQAGEESGWMRTDWRPEFVELVRRGKTTREAAELLGLHRSTPCARVRRGDEDLAEKWRTARMKATASTRRRAA